jgi:phosphoketolase
MKRLFKQFSFPGGIPSHVAPEIPGSIHEGESSATQFLMPMALPLIILT